MTVAMTSPASYKRAPSWMATVSSERRQPKPLRGDGSAHMSAKLQVRRLCSDEVPALNEIWCANQYGSLRRLPADREALWRHARCCAHSPGITSTRKLQSLKYVRSALRTSRQTAQVRQFSKHDCSVLNIRGRVAKTSLRNGLLHRVQKWATPVQFASVPVANHFPALRAEFGAEWTMDVRARRRPLRCPGEDSVPPTAARI